ncbi:MAG: hypothetical protein U0800_23955 [Isosphaeraceae bacterium]
MSNLPNPLPGAPGGDDQPRGQFLNRIDHPLPTPNDVGMAEDPVVAGVEAVLEVSRPHDSLAQLGDGGAWNSAWNARKHGLTAEGRTAREEGRYQEVLSAHHASLAPEIPEEVGAVERASKDMFMWEKCDVAIQSLAITCIDEHKAERRKPLEAQVARLESSLRLWERAQAHKHEFGRGLGNAYPVLLKDLDPEVSVKNLRDSKAREFAMAHGYALANDRLMELFRRYSRQEPADRNEPDFREYLMLRDAMIDDQTYLMGWVQSHVMNLRNLLEKARRDLARADAMPVDKNVLTLKSDDFRKFRRYQREYESSYYRNLKGFDAIRGRLMTGYDRQMRNIQKEYDVMFKVGPLGIHLPPQLSRLCPYDQLDAMVRILQREQRYYDPNSRNAARENAARAKLYETETITAATWNGIDSDGKGGKRIIGGESSLMPPPGAPKPPDTPESPR